MIVLVLSQCSRSRTSWRVEGALPDGHPFLLQGSGAKPSVSHIEAAVFVGGPHPKAIGAHSFGRTDSFVVADDEIHLRGCGWSIVIKPYADMKQAVDSEPVKYSVKCESGFPVFVLGKPYRFGLEPETDSPPAVNFVGPNFRVTSGCRPSQFVVCSKNRSLMAIFDSVPVTGFRISNS